MTASLARNPRLLRDLLADSIRENRRLRRLVVEQRNEIDRITQQRTEFDLSADVPALCRKQA
jgi:hypothetical protein